MVKQNSPFHPQLPLDPLATQQISAFDLQPDAEDGHPALKPPVRQAFALSQPPSLQYATVLLQYQRIYDEFQ